jgi:hypothetical protein
MIKVLNPRAVGMPQNKAARLTIRRLTSSGIPKESRLALLLGLTLLITLGDAGLTDALLAGLLTDLLAGLLAGLLALDFAVTDSGDFFKSLDFLGRLFGSKGKRSDLFIVNYSVLKF